jgi:predicted aspartyl protease
MRIKGANGVGRFSIDVEVANYGDIELATSGHLPEAQVRRETIRGVVDSGAAMLVLPQAVAKRLGLRLGRTAKVRYADGRRAQRREATGVYLKLLGRETTLPALIEPNRHDALIGAIVLEALDLLVDCKTQQVVPRDPSGPIYEIE